MKTLKLFAYGLPVAMAASVLLTGASFAEKIVKDVVIGKTVPGSDVPAVTSEELGGENNVVFKVHNRTSAPAYFTIEEIGLSQMIPPYSTAPVFVESSDMENTSSGLNYKIQSALGYTLVPTLEMATAQQPEGKLYIAPGDNGMIAQSSGSAGASMGTSGSGSTSGTSGSGTGTSGSYGGSSTGTTGTTGSGSSYGSSTGTGSSYGTTGTDATGTSQQGSSYSSQYETQTTQTGQSGTTGTGGATQTESQYDSNSSYQRSTQPSGNRSYEPTTTQTTSQAEETESTTSSYQSQQGSTVRGYW